MADSTLPPSDATQAAIDAEIAAQEAAARDYRPDVNVRLLLLSLYILFYFIFYFFTLLKFLFLEGALCCPEIFAILSMLTDNLGPWHQ